MFRMLFTIATLAAIGVANTMSRRETSSIGCKIAPSYGNSTRDVETLNENIRSRYSPCTATDQCSFVDKLERRDGRRWDLAHNYANGKSFAAWWSKTRVRFNKRTKNMEIRVGRQAGLGKPYVSGQMQSKRWHGYGCFEVRMKPAKQEGLVTTFFSFTGPHDAARGKPKKHNEVDIEFVYKRKYGGVMLQANYFTNGRGNHERLIRLRFNPADSMNNYGFKWTSRKVEWYVNGRKVYTARKDIPKISQGPHKMMMSLWPVSEHSAAWAGRFQWRGPTGATYSAVRFTRGESCRIQNRF